MTQASKGMWIGLLAVCGFALTLPVTRFLVPYLDPMLVGPGRAVPAAVGAAVLLLCLRQPWPSRAQWARLLVVAAGVVIGFPWLSAWAMQTVPATHGAVMLGVLPLATAVMGALLGPEQPSRGFWLAAVMGSGLVAAYALFQGAGALQGADWALLAAVLCAALGYAVGAQLVRELGAWQVICWALLAAAPLSLALVWQQAGAALWDLPPRAYLGFLYLALVSQWLAFFLWYYGLALGGTARVSQTQLLQPFITLLAAVVWFDEGIDALTLGFALMVVASVWLGKRMPIHRAD